MKIHWTISRVYTKEPADWWRCAACGAEGDGETLSSTECKSKLDIEEEKHEDCDCSSCLPWTY